MMKLSRITVLVVVLLLLMAFGVGAALVSAQETEEGNCLSIRDRIGKRFGANLTEEARAELGARREALAVAQEKWAELSDEQKEEIYGLQEEIGQLQNRMVSRYQEWGVYDEETASQIQAKISERVTRMRENDRMPMGFGRRAIRRGVCCNPDNFDVEGSQ